MMKLNYIVVFLYMLTGVVDYFGSSDKVHPQTLYLNCLNLISLFLILKQNKFKSPFEIFKKILSNNSVALLLLFFIWSSVTVFFAINLGESFKTLTEVFTVIISLIMMLYFLEREVNKERLIFLVIISTGLIELVTVYVPYIQDIYLNGSPVERSLSYRGITGSINVISYTLLIKLPFIFYYTITKKKNRIFFILISALIMYAIIGILETRSAILTLLAVLVLSFLVVKKYYSIQKKSFNYSIKRGLIITMLPFMIAFFANNISSNIFDSVNVQNRLETLTRLQGDDSLNERFRYAKAGLSSIIKKPFFGVGIGNWELESIKYDKDNMVSYVVPYHAHNDYIETFAETGLIGFLTYFGAIFIILYITFKSSLLFYNDKDINKSLFNMFICISLFVYLSDSIFNFPFDRTYQQINLMFLLSLGILFANHKLNFNNFHFTKYFSLLFVLLPFSLYSSYIVYDASKDHVLLLRAFNAQEWSYPSLDIIDKLNDTYPTLTPTTLPIRSIKGIYYVENEKYREGISLLKSGTKYNPHIYMSEAFISYAYWKLDNIDSANYYAKKAFYNLPNNLIHWRNYAITLSELKDSVELKKAYDYIPIKLDENKHEEIYLTAMSLFLSDESKTSVLSDLDIDLESANDRLRRGYYQMTIGNKNMLDGDTYYQLGELSFSQEKFADAAALFAKAAELNPYEQAYRENLANSYLRLGEFNKSIEILNQLIDIDNTTSVNAYYLRALAYLNLGNYDMGCIDLKFVDDLNYLGDQGIYENFCANK